MNIWLRIHGIEFCSWYIVFRHLHKAFREIGVNVMDSPFNPPKKPNDYIELFWGDPQFWEWSQEKVKLRAGIVLSEHRSLLNPGKAIKNLQQCNVLISPCQSAAQAFYEAPLDMPIRIAPFGVDETDLKYHRRKWDRVLNFLLIGVAQFRKGSWLAVEAFRKAFGDQKEVNLTVASFVDSPMFRRLQNDYGTYPNIQFEGKAEKVKEIYHSNHVLISPHLSEGWGLTIPEAMATGMPGIIARCSAPREYFSLDFGWWIEMSELYAPIDQCLPGVHGSWRLPAVDSLVEKMRYANEHREECDEKGKKASEYARSSLTWKQSAKKIIEILEGI